MVRYTIKALTDKGVKTLDEMLITILKDDNKVKDKLLKKVVRPLFKLERIDLDTLSLTVAAVPNSLLSNPAFKHDSIRKLYYEMKQRFDLSDQDVLIEAA